MLWRRWQEARDPPAREALILAYAPLVRYLAGRLHVGLAGFADLSDLESYGLFGLMDAIERFDPSRGTRFESFAATRIRGAIIDGLRAETWAPALRTKARQLQLAYSSLETQLGRPPGDAELAAALGIRIAELARREAELGALSILSLDEPMRSSDDGEGLRLADSLPDASAPDPEAELQKVEGEARRRELVARALAKLTDKERMVITLYYYEELTTKEIGQVLGLTPARVSQLHNRAILRLRGALARCKRELADLR